MQQQPVAQPQVVKRFSWKKRIMMGVVIALSAIAVVILLFGLYYYLGPKKHALPNSPEEIGGGDENRPAAPVKKVTPTPDLTVGWQQYTNAQYKYSIKYPSTVTPSEQNTNYHYVAFQTTGQALPTYLVSVIPDNFFVKDPAAYNFMSADFINSLTTMKINESKKVGDITFVRLTDTVVQNLPAKVIQVITNTYRQDRVYVKTNGRIYMISNSYTSIDEVQSFFTFLSTFNLLK